ncbi:hypothetical protein [Cytobacillus gottheilii]|uniref:hypothetical protein n=1 Tax=Cytobacillus gottheilii TaxID=859144 RepID=UPI0009B997C1|nr:hypothetical protein [Cytobacillus gottheilii]
MFLTYRDIAELFPKRRGIANEDLSFYHVTCSPDFPQPKGLYISTSLSAEGLKTALENGAIAAVWDESADVPKFTPNHFPLFFSNNVLKGLLDMMKLYEQKTKNMGSSSGNWTNFHVNSAVIPDEFEYREELRMLFAKLDEDGRLGGKE